MPAASVPQDLQPEAAPLQRPMAASISPGYVQPSTLREIGTTIQDMQQVVIHDVDNMNASVSDAGNDYILLRETHNGHPFRMAAEPLVQEEGRTTRER